MNDQHIDEAQNLEIQPTGDPIVGTAPLGERTIRLGRSPVSRIIDEVWMTPEPPPRKPKRARRPKTPLNERSGVVSLSTEGEITIKLSREQLIATFDGLKLLLAELAAANPQPLQPIYIVTDAIRRLEPVVMEQVRAQVGARPERNADGK